MFSRIPLMNRWSLLDWIFFLWLVDWGKVVSAGGRPPFRSIPVRFRRLFTSSIRLPKGGASFPNENWHLICNQRVLGLTFQSIPFSFSQMSFGKGSGKDEGLRWNGFTPSQLGSQGVALPPCFRNDLFPPRES